MRSNFSNMPNQHNKWMAQGLPWVRSYHREKTVGWAREAAHRSLRIAIILAATFITLTGCETANLLSNFNLISPQQEKQLGVQLSQDIAKQQEIVSDPQIEGYIQSIGVKLVSASMNPSAEYHFHVLKDDQVNAFAIPGGQLYVQTGLIAAAGNEAELAAVMAHELGHAEERHPTKSMSQQMGAQVIMSMILGENPGQLSQTAASLVTNSGISYYSRSAELEADKIAVYILNRAGYDPGAMVSFFEKLVELERQSGASGGGLFATHPPTQERINAANALIATFGNERQRGTEIVGGFAGVKEKVKGL